MQISLSTIITYNSIPSTTSRTIETDDIEYISAKGSGCNIILRSNPEGSPDLIETSSSVADIVALATDGSLHTASISRIKGSEFSIPISAAIATSKVYMIERNGSSTNIYLSTEEGFPITINETIDTYIARFNALAYEGHVLEKRNLQSTGSSSAKGVVAFNLSYVSEEIFRSENDLEDGRVFRYVDKQIQGGVYLYQFNLEPSLQAAVVENADDDGLVLTFSEVMTSVDYAGWTVTVGGSPRAVSSGAGSGTNTFTLTLASAVTAAQQVLVSYNPVTGSTQTRDTDEEIDAISDFVVTNNVS